MHDVWHTPILSGRHVRLVPLERALKWLPALQLAADALGRIEADALGQVPAAKTRKK